jgi:hypothetical protein
MSEAVQSIAERNCLQYMEVHENHVPWLQADGCIPLLCAAVVLQGADVELAAAESALDELMEAQIEAALAGGGGSDDDDDDMAAFGLRDGRFSCCVLANQGIKARGPSTILVMAFAFAVMSSSVHVCDRRFSVCCFVCLYGTMPLLCAS